VSAPTGPAAPLNVLVTDRILSRFGAELTRGDSTARWTMAADWTPEQVLAELPRTDVLVCSAMTPGMAAAGQRLRLVQVTGAGLDKIPLTDLAPGVAVANTFHHGRPIAEHVIMVSLMLNRHVLAADAQMRAGRWLTVATDPGVPFHGVLAGRTVGLLGLGGIGQEVARLAGALGMTVQAIRRNPHSAVPDDLDLAWVGGLADLPRLMGTSDIVVVTIPLSESTRGVVDAAELAMMRPTAILVNVARGAVVDEDALYEALAAGTIAGAGIDVWWGVPSGQSSPPATERFAALDNVVLTPHHSGHARTTFELRAGDIAGNVQSVAAGLPLRNQVHGPRPE
jgi:phosphoglycerate dehydrogenase-like enzyme